MVILCAWCLLGCGLAHAALGLGCGTRVRGWQLKRQAGEGKRQGGAQGDGAGGSGSSFGTPYGTAGSALSGALASSLSTQREDVERLLSDTESKLQFL